MKKKGILIAVLGCLSVAVVAAETNRVGIVNQAQLPEKLVVLTFDDAIRSQHSVVAPILKEYGFGATFFICEFPPEFETDKNKYMTWGQIAELNRMGFEIANHTLTHAHIGKISDEQLAEELHALSEREPLHRDRHARLVPLRGGETGEAGARAGMGEAMQITGGKASRERRSGAEV